MQADGQQENSQRFRARNDSSRDPQRKQIAQRRTVPQRKRLLEVKPGVFLYRLRYRCDGQEKVKTGNLTVLK